MAAADVLDQSPARRFPPAVMAWYGLAVLIGATIFAAIDRQILLLVTEPLKHALVLSDTQIGTLNGVALSAVAALATFPMAWLADRLNRKVLLAVCVVIWSASTAACGLSHSFAQLFVASVGIAVGEAILGPISYSFIPLLFPRDRWILANYVYFVAGIVGAAVGMWLSGAAIAGIDSLRASLTGALAGLDAWRLALIGVAIPGPLLAAMILAIQTARPSAAVSRAEQPGLLAFVRAHLRTLSGVFLGYGFAATVQGTVAIWTPVALVRLFHQTPAQTGMRLGAVSIVGAVSGVLISGALVRLLTPRVGQLTALKVSQIGALAALAITSLYFVADAAWMLYAIAFVQAVAMTCCLSLSPTVLQFIAPDAMRGRVIALGGLFYMVFLSISPVVVGKVSDMLGARPHALLLAMATVGLPCLALALGLFRMTEATFSSTLAAADDD